MSFNPRGDDSLLLLLELGLAGYDQIFEMLGWSYRTKYSVDNI